MLLACSMHPLRLIIQKIEAGAFNGPQIRTFVRDQGFTQTKNDKEKAE